MKLPKHTDDEVRFFHPIFESCAKQALLNLNLENEIRVVHHRSFNGITVDFSIERIKTSKIILLVEIKRTQSAIESTRYRHQALSYRKEADHLSETNYYILTNLEKTDLFKYDKNKPRVCSQLVNGSPFRAGSFSQENSDDFVIKLIQNIQDILTIAINDLGNYDDNIDKLYFNLQDQLENYDSWHKKLMPFSYEYIRGASTNYTQLSEKIKLYRWGAVEQYKNQPSRISEKGNSIDFEHVFKEPYPKANDLDSFDTALLESAYKSGKARGQAEDIAEIIYKLLELKQRPGIVETDEELARLLSILAKLQLDAPILSDEFICDPAAGSGRLLVAAAQTNFTELEPCNFWANEIERNFSETLSLRLGLQFANVVSPENAPRITLTDISNLTKSDFAKVKIILLNPPYISGVASKNEKTIISKAIKKLSGKNSITNKGQIGLEVPFLELVHVLSQPETVIAAIMPYSLLTRKSKEIQDFRRFLINHFGLVMIVTYPREGLFEKVIKKTCIIIGKTGGNDKTVDCVEIKAPIECLDLHDFEISIKNKKNMRICSIHTKGKDFYIDNIESGWVADIKNDAKKWLLKAFPRELFSIDNYVVHIKRGTSGNRGASDLSAMSNEKLIKIVPENKTLPALNKAITLQKIMDKDNAPCISPRISFSNNTYDDFVSELIQAYLLIKNSLTATSGKQAKAPLSYDKVLLALKMDIKLSPENSILLPRAIRANCAVGICVTPYVVSTNFFVFQCKNKTDALIIGSWLLSIFGQIQMEYLSNDQEGMRKLEKKEIGQLLIPDINRLSENEISKLILAYENSAPITCDELKVRDVDKVWAEILSNSSDTLIHEAFDLMSDLIESRSP